MRTIPLLLAALTLAFGAAISTAWAYPTPRTVIVSVTNSNVPGSGTWGADTSQVVYVLPSPLMHAPGCASCGTPYTDFIDRIHAVGLSTKGGSVSAGKPRLVFTGPKGDIISFQSVAGNWVVFEEYNDSYDGGPWAMMALNTVTRRVIALDSREREGVPSLSPIPHTDGKRVVWQSWTTNNGTITSVVRTYDLQSGKRQMVAEGGTIKGWSYFGASISGDRVIFSKQYPATELAQVMLANLKTGRVTALTPASKATSSPWISGDLAVWRVGWNFSITKTIVVRNLRTGGQRTIPADNAQLPEIMLGRYVVFSTGYSAKDERIHVYDAQTHKGRVLVGPGTWSQGRYPGGFFAVGGHALSYQLGHKYNPATPEKIVVTMLR